MSGGFFEEVKRRNVYRVAAAYIIAAGGIIQLASAAFPAWELPNWALRLVIVLLLVGFPIALILAYYIGFARKALHDEPGARAAFQKAKSAAEKQVSRSPDSEDAHIQLAKILAYLGQREAALAEAQRAGDLLPQSKDAFGGPEIAVGAAEVYTVLGDNDSCHSNFGRIIEPAQRCHRAELENKSDLGSTAKRSALSGPDAEIRR
jgi:tetratricopeptide (TPR) repeat protein